MSIVTSKGMAEYRLTPDQLREIIAKDMGVDSKTIEVSFVIERQMDPFDRGPGTPYVSAAKVKVLPSGAASERKS